MLIPSLILDGAAILILIFTVIYYTKIGFVRSVLSFLGSLAVFVTAIIGSRFLSVYIFDNFMKEYLQGLIAENISQNGFIDVESYFVGMFETLPKELITSILQILQPIIDANSDDISAQIVSQVVEPLVVPLLAIILFIVLYIVLRLIIKSIISMINKMARMPVLKSINSALGAVMGVGIGIMYIYLVLLVIWGMEFLQVFDMGSAAYFSKALVYKLLLPFNILDIFLL